MQLADVIARLTALEASIRDLEQELARAKVGGFRSMRETRRCPACGGGSLLHIQHDIGQVSIHHEIGFWGTKKAGPIEHFVCRGCLLVESHVSDLTGVEPNGKDVIAIEPESDVPSDGPFR